MRLLIARDRDVHYGTQGVCRVPDGLHTANGRFPVVVDMSAGRKDR